MSGLIYKTARCDVFLKSFISRDTKTMLKFFTNYVRPILEFSSSVWSPITSSDKKNKLENVQKYYINKIQSCTFLSYHLRLNILSISSLQHRRLINDL